MLPYSLHPGSKKKQAEEDGATNDIAGQSKALFLLH